MLSKVLTLVLLQSMLFSAGDWKTDFDKAKQEAAAEQKYILLNFSGSDWCGPCIRMHHDFFNDPPFNQLADKHLVLINADFPRQKKNQLSKKLQEQNNQLADKYNPAGIFPLTLLLDAKGAVLKTWEGYPKLTPLEFVTMIKDITHVAE